MKLILRDAEQFVFHLSLTEQNLLFKMLELYPLVPAAHQQLSKTERRPEDQQALEQALTGHRQANKKALQAFLESPETLKQHGDDYRLALSCAQMEWLLQVINDLQVGSWLLLGSPEGSTDMPATFDETTMRYVWTIELARYFQKVLLDALNGEPAEGPETDDAQ